MIVIDLPPFGDEKYQSMLLMEPSMTEVGQIPFDLVQPPIKDLQPSVMEVGIREGSVFIDITGTEMYIDRENVLSLVSCLLNKLYALRGVNPEHVVKTLDFKHRVENEFLALNDNLTKLTAFIGTSIFYGLSVNEQVRLKCQQVHMRNYADTLCFRIRNDFK